MDMDFGSSLPNCPLLLSTIGGSLTLGGTNLITSNSNNYRRYTTGGDCRFQEKVSFTKLVTDIQA